MTQTNPLPGIALQWKAVGPFNQAPQATVSIQPHFPFGEGAGNTGNVVFPATNVNASNASFFATPLIGTFDMVGRLLGPDGYPLVVPALDVMNDWLNQPTLYEIQIDILGVSGQRGVFVAFAYPASNTGWGQDGIILADTNASISAMTGSGGIYTGTVYLADTVVSPILVNQSIMIAGAENFTAVVNSIDLATNSIAVTTTASQSAETNVTFYWGYGDGSNLGVDLSQYVNWF